MLRKDPFVTGEYYHIYNRGIDKRSIFKVKGDYERFVMLLHLANSTESVRLGDLLDKKKSNKTYFEVLALDKVEPLVSIGAWCLMTNHFHLLVKQEVDGGITTFMKKLSTGYSMFFNLKYQRAGALFGGLFKSKLIGVKDLYLKHLFGYIHINPLEIKFPKWKTEAVTSSTPMRKFLDSYAYSSYLDYLGVDRAEKGIIQPENFPGYFENSSRFKDFVADYYSQESTTS